MISCSSLPRLEHLAQWLLKIKLGTHAIEDSGCVQYGGEEDGIDRQEFQNMLHNLDGFSELDDCGAHNVRSCALAATALDCTAGARSCYNELAHP